MLPVFLGLVFLLGFISWSLSPVFFTGKAQLTVDLSPYGLEVSLLLNYLWIGLLLFVFIGLIACFLALALQR